MRRADNNMMIYLVRFFNRHTLQAINWKAFTKKEDAEKAILFLLESGVITNLAEAGIQNIILEGIYKEKTMSEENIKISNEKNIPNCSEHQSPLTPIVINKKIEEQLRKINEEMRNKAMPVVQWNPATIAMLNK